MNQFTVCECSSYRNEAVMIGAVAAALVQHLSEVDSVALRL